MIRDSSANVARNWNLSIDILFIDGDHSYDAVANDFYSFSKYVNKFGIIIFHDTMWNLTNNHPLDRQDMGVPRFVEKHRAEGYPVVTFPKNYGISIVQGVKSGIGLS